MPIGAYGRSREDAQHALRERVETIIPPDIWQIMEALQDHIEEHLSVVPEITFRKHGRRERLTVKLLVYALGDPVASVSNAPSDRYPKVRAFLAHEILEKFGLKLSHESEMHPYVSLEFMVGIPVPDSWWVSFFKPPWM